MTESVDLDVQRERAAKNQSLFREVNERIEELSRSEEQVRFICECASDDCEKTLTLTVTEYERIRSRSNSFFVLAGHEVPEVEEVIDSNGRYVIVAKLGAGAPVAEHFDPRKHRSS